MLCVPLSLHNIALCTPKSEMTTYQCDSDVIEGSLTETNEIIVTTTKKRVKFKKKFVLLRLGEAFWDIYYFKALLRYCNSDINLNYILTRDQ